MSKKNKKFFRCEVHTSLLGKKLNVYSSFRGKNRCEVTSHILHTYPNRLKL